MARFMQYIIPIHYYKNFTFTFDQVTIPSPVTATRALRIVVDGQRTDQDAIIGADAFG